jgi:RimJ/RimL family protein N-acetyltransferase
MTEAVRAVLTYGFREVELNRFSATVVTANVASANLLEGLSNQSQYQAPPVTTQSITKSAP